VNFLADQTGGDPISQDSTGQFFYDWKNPPIPNVTDDPGVPGQGTANPPSIFQSHRVAKIAGIYYDPSYGKKYTSLDDMESKAIDGYVKNSTYQGSIRFVFQMPPAGGSNLREDPP
jgi:hypothetical protein